MLVEFKKMNGAGNDFVMVADFFDQIDFTPEQVAHICDRHFGVGADGIIVVKPSKRDECPAYMDYYNSDGTKAEMCGNGVRCFSKFLADSDVIEPGQDSYIADTLSGPKPITIHRGADGKMTTASVDMGAPILRAADIPTTLGEAETECGPAVVEQKIEVAGREFLATCVSMGNPHAVIFVEDPVTFPAAEIGSQIEVLGIFPEKTNVEFAKVTGSDIEMRVWERGCGETLACGTGCCATGVAAYLTGRAPREVTVHVLGGDIHINWLSDTSAEGGEGEPELGHVIMTGPAEESFSGTFEI